MIDFESSKSRYRFLPPPLLLNRKAGPELSSREIQGLYLEGAHTEIG